MEYGPIPLNKIASNVKTHAQFLLNRFLNDSSSTKFWRHKSVRAVFFIPTVKVVLASLPRLPPIAPGRKRRLWPFSLASGSHVFTQTNVEAFFTNSIPECKRLLPCKTKPIQAYYVYYRCMHKFRKEHSDSRKVFITENKNNLISKRPEVHCLVGFNVHRFQWTTLYILPENVHQRPELYFFGSQDLNTAFALLNVLTLKDDCGNIQQLVALLVLQSGKRGTRLSKTHANGTADSKSASDWL